jgi:hypothetical protein
MFKGARLKIGRADHHISDLERQFAAFVAEKPHRFSMHIDPHTLHTIMRVSFIKEVPAQFALIIGDAIHNLRTALDHTVWEIVGFAQRTQDRQLAFPTGHTRTTFESSCNGIKAPSQWVRDALMSTEVFPQGTGDDLYNLTRLDNADKHTVITPVLRGTSLPSFTVFTEDGKVASRIEIKVLVGRTADFADDFADFGMIQPGFQIRLDEDAECSPSLFLGFPDGTRFAPAFPTLERLRNSVANAVDTLESKVPS